MQGSSWVIKESVYPYKQGDLKNQDIFCFT